MAKLRKKFIKMRVEEESVLPHDKLIQKLDEIIDMQYRRNLLKFKGSPVFLWSKLDEDCYRLKYYHSYKEDMCDTVLTVDIEKGLERSSVHGFIHKPKSIWAVFWGVIASVFIDFLILSYCLLFVGGFDLVNGLIISGCACLVRAYICVALLEINRDRVKELKAELFRVIRNEKQAQLFRQTYYDDLEENEEETPDDGVTVIEDGE